MNETRPLSPPIVSGAIDYQQKLSSLESLVVDLADKLVSLNTKYDILNSIVTDVLNRVEKTEETSIKFNDKIKYNESYIKNQDIYSRRNNIEFCNISENIRQRDLEPFILKMLNSVNINVNSYDIVAVHRLGKYINGKTRNVIVRFVNRKNSYKCFGIGKKLKSINEYKNKRIYTIENLCPTNKRIFNALYKLKKNGIVHSVWTRNGRVYYQENDVDDNFIEAESLDDIEFLFNDGDGEDTNQVLHSEGSEVSESSS